MGDNLQDSNFPSDSLVYRLYVHLSSWYGIPVAMRDQSLTFATFLVKNARWLTGGMLLSFFSSVGQTFFISLFAGQIRSEFHLSHGTFGFVYMLATLGSAVTLVWLGKVVDAVSIATASRYWITALAAAAVLMAFANSPLILLIALYLLRLLGQGMLSHTALVAMGRWFHAERGRAVSDRYNGTSAWGGAAAISCCGSADAGRVAFRVVIRSLCAHLVRLAPESSITVAASCAFKS